MRIKPSNGDEYAWEAFEVHAKAEGYGDHIEDWGPQYQTWCLAIDSIRGTEDYRLVREAIRFAQFSSLVRPVFQALERVVAMDKFEMISCQWCGCWIGENCEQPEKPADKCYHEVPKF